MMFHSLEGGVNRGVYGKDWQQFLHRAGFEESFVDSLELTSGIPIRDIANKWSAVNDELNRALSVPVLVPVAPGVVPAPVLVP